MIDVCMFMYRIGRSSVAGLILCLVSKLRKERDEVMTIYIDMSFSLFIILCALVIHSVSYFRYIGFIVPMSAVHVSINFN